ncbi:ATP-binding protein [Nocardioides sp. WS12]|uniref:AAA family ATPase n=1 Tax=Nocardioides sp. WS12 TaxID=2486272 RepID=UPI0015F86135|nr:ATP-binding protein [Nocardioides sp. WS12]
MGTSDLFHEVITLPEPVRSARYKRLVGLDDHKSRLRKEAAVLADPSKIDAWAQQHHNLNFSGNVALTLLKDRAPLLLFAGDVGSGKSALAESFGCDLAEQLGVDVTLYRLKLTTRGEGHVGEMTNLIGKAFNEVTSEAKMGRSADGRLLGITVLVVDEADALVQSREATQMHHEDRAGVDAFLQGIDDFAGTGLPLLVVMCTNRLAALDPAVRRRAAAVFSFRRPNDAQRKQVLSDALEGYGISPESLDKLVLATGPQGAKRPGFTFSDLTQRLVPTAILAAYPDQALSADLILNVASDMDPTPEFNDAAAS